MKFHFFFMLFVMTVSGTCQTAYISISGIVRDKKTGEPLDFASISLKGTALGTVSNQRGEFEFKVASAHGNDTLMISYVGYKSIKMIASEAANRVSEYFFLEESVTELTSVVIVAGQSYAEGIVKQAIGNMERVYPTEEFILECFYREWEIRQVTVENNKDRASIVEAAIRIVDGGIDPKTPKLLKEKVYLLELRKIIAAGESVEGTEFGWLLRQNPVNYRKGKAHFFVPGALDIPNNLEYEYHNTVAFDDEEVHVITVRVPAFLSAYTLYVSTKDYAVLRIDLHAKAEGGEFVHHDPADRRYRVVFIDNTLRFRRVAGTPYIRYMRMHWEWEKYDSLAGRQEEGENYKELVVNDIHTDPAIVEALKNQMKIPPVRPGESLYENARPYNAVFWEHYNVIKENPLNRRLLDALEQPGKTVEENFEEKNDK